MKSKVTSITQGTQGRFDVSRSQQKIISRRGLFIKALAAAGGSQLIAARRADVPFANAKEWTRDLAMGIDPRKAA